MIQKFQNFEWCGVEVKPYKDNPGHWLSVTRQTLFAESEAAFQVRYFEVQPGGYTSFEKHDHEHCVVVVRGRGRVRLGNDWSEIDLHDAVHVPPQTPHQFEPVGNEPLGILCIVDKERDRPTLLDPEGNPHTSE